MWKVMEVVVSTSFMSLQVWRGKNSSRRNEKDKVRKRKGWGAAADRKGEKEMCSPHTAWEIEEQQEGPREGRTFTNSGRV